MLITFINENHYYETYKNQNNIYTEYQEKLNPYTEIDLVNGSYISSISISDLPLTDADIYYISENFKSLRFMDTCNCTFGKDLSLYNLPISCFLDIESSFDSLKVFDGSNFCIALINSTILNNFDNILHLNGEEIKLSNVSMDYKMFFLKTEANNLKKLTIEREEPLNDNDLMFLDNFYNLEELDIHARVKNYNLLYRLDKLKELPEHFLITDKEELGRLNKKFEKRLAEIKNNYGDEFEKQFDVNHYLMYQRSLIERQNQTFYKLIRIPRASKVHWQGMLSKCDDDIRSILIDVSKMPIKLKKMIGTNEETSIISKNPSDYLERLELLTAMNPDNHYLKKYHQASIYGIDGNKLIKESSFMDLTRERPFLDSKGNILCTFVYREEQNIIIPEHYKEEIHKKRADLDPNLTNYYNQYNNHKAKLDFLNNKLINVLNDILSSDNTKVSIHKDLNKMIHQYNVLKLLEKYKDKFETNYRYVLITEPEDNGYVYDIAFKIKKMETEDRLLSFIDFVSSERELDSEDKDKLSKDVHKYYNYYKKEQSIRSKFISIDKTVEKYFQECGINITSSIDRQNINEYFLDDIDRLQLNYHLSNNDGLLFKYYILYLQEQYNLDVQMRIERLESSEFYYSERFDSYYSWDEFDEEYEKTGLDGVLEKGYINQEEYQSLCAYEMLDDMISQEDKKQEQLSIKRNEAIYSYLDVINNFTLEDVIQIKELIPTLIDDRLYDKKSLYIDQIIKYITGDYPKWVQRDIEKLPYESAREKDTIEVQRSFVNEHSIKVKGIKPKISYEHSNNINPSQ
jgi:ribosomal protein S17E